MAVRFPYRRIPRTPVGSDMSEDGGFIGGQGRAPSSEPPVIDPAILASVNPGIARQMERAGGYNDKTTQPSVVTNPDIPPAITPTIIDPWVGPVVDTRAAAPTTEELGAPPVMVTHDKRGRPQTTIGGADAAERNKAITEAVDAYVPQKEPKWKRYLRLLGLGASMVGGALGHDSETVARATYGLGQNLLNSKLPDENWKRGKQAEAAAETDRALKQRKTAAEIADIESRPDQRRLVQALRKQGLDNAGKRVSDARMKAALEMYYKNDYTPGENKPFDDYLADSGLHNLPARSAAAKWEYKLIDGDLIRVPKSGTGGAENVTYSEESGGGLVNDPSKTADQSITIGDQIFTHLTPREVMLMGGKLYEGEEGRQSRENIAAASQAGQDRRKAMGGGGVKAGAINPTVKGAVGALSRFRALTARIEAQKAYYGKDDHPVVKALYDQRDGLERDMKQLYGNYLELDSNGKPAGLKESAYTPEASTIDLTGQQRSVSAWRKQYPKATAEQEVAWKAKVTAAGGTVIR